MVVRMNLLLLPDIYKFYFEHHFNDASKEKKKKNSEKAPVRYKYTCMRKRRKFFNFKSEVSSCVCCVRVFISFFGQSEDDLVFSHQKSIQFIIRFV